MSKNVVFLSLFDLTRVFFAVSDRLRREGHQVFWMSTSRTWTNWLQEQGVAGDDVLSLIYTEADFLSSLEKEALIKQILACETGAELTINQCLLMDRFVRFRDSGTINDYVYRYYRDIKKFLISRRVDVVFAEPTNLNELITYLVCRELGIRFLAPSNMRYPPNRMIFTSGFLQDRLVSGEGSVPDGAGEELLRRFEATQIRPKYFEKLNRARVLTPTKLWRSARNRIRRRELTQQPNLTHHPVTERAALMIRRLVNSFYLRNLAKYDDLELIEGRIAFFGLHVQPESSIDVCGSYFSDQLKLIEDIRRALPFDLTLVVKEHPNFLGIRGRSFMNQLRRIPNVRIVKHDVSTFDIYRRACVVFTVSGTVGYEAGMLGVPAVVFSPVYFSRLSSVYCCTEITRLKDLLEKIVVDHQRDFEVDCREMERLLAGSFEGLWADAFNLPEVMAKENIAHLQDAFGKLMQDLDRQGVDTSG